ncbi:MAG TPA: DsbA family oxidoreductase [Cyclobacteriaceae bacterium]|nr:DsbA family oxidoreductase [Cyclobacteriaceae bacterium]
MTKPKIKVDVVSDVVCPWCYIGKRRIEKAMDALADRYDFEVEYHPFELNPGMPASGADQKQYLSDKFGGNDRYEKITAQTTAAAAGEGLNFDFAKQKISPNTREAHRIIQFAKNEGKQPAVKEAFMKAYFEQGIDLSKKENLVSVAVSAGLSKQAVETLLATTEGLAQVEQREHELQKLGISGVPFYIINNKYGISGAQASETFMQAFENVGKEVAVSGEACGVDSKNC